MDLKKIRTEQKLTQVCLAELSGVPYRTIQDIENKHTDCHISTAIKLADALNITLDKLCRN